MLLTPGFDAFDAKRRGEFGFGHAQNVVQRGASQIGVDHQHTIHHMACEGDVVFLDQRGSGRSEPELAWYSISSGIPSAT